MLRHAPAECLGRRPWRSPLMIVSPRWTRLASVADVVHNSPQEETLMDDGLSRPRSRGSWERGAAGASALLADAPM